MKGRCLVFGWAVILLIAGVITSASATVITLPSSGDAFMNHAGAWNDSCNCGANTWLCVGKRIGPELRRTLIKFDLDTIPACATVTFADLDLYCWVEEDTSITSTIRCYRVRRDWGEGNKTGQPATPGESAWLFYAMPNLWAAPGCDDTTSDRSGTPEATDYVHGLGWYTWPIGSAVQNWVDGSWSNYGLVFICDDEVSPTMKRFYSREDTANPTLRPRLTVGYWLQDVGVSSIDSPPDTVISGFGYTPMATVFNSGDTVATFNVSLLIDSSGVAVYGDTAIVVNLVSPGTTQVSFANWTVPPVDSTFYNLTVMTLLSPDCDPTNDVLSKRIFAYGVGIQEIPDAGGKKPEARLYQNHPNPFGQGGTSISFNVTRSTLNVSLRVYNLSGRLVKTLVDGGQSVTSYELPVAVRWDGRDQSGRLVVSGVYFYKLTAGDYAAVRKMMVVR